MDWPASVRQEIVELELIVAVGPRETSRQFWQYFFWVARRPSVTSRSDTSNVALAHIFPANVRLHILG